MSASTPGRKNSSRGAASRAQTPFWFLSLTLHGIMLALVIFVAPVREIVFHRKAVAEPEVITRGDELQEVIEKIRDRTAEKLRARVALLEAGQERMARNFNIINRHFQPFAEQQRATARSRMQKYIRDAISRQEEVVRAFQKAKEENVPEAAVESSRKNQAHILTAQEEIRRGIRLLKLGGDELLAQQKKAEETQYNAGQFARWLAGDLSEITRKGAKITDLEKLIADMEAQLPDHEKAALEERKRSDDLEAERKKLEKEYRDNARKKDRDWQKQMKKQIDRIRRDWLAARRKASTADSKLKRAKADLDRKRAELARVREQLRKNQANRQTHIEVGFNVHRSAYFQQKAVVDAVVQYLGSGAAGGADE